MQDRFETQSPNGEIQMQPFQDGQPPAPPVSHSWKKIDRWAEENYPELFDQLCDGCTTNDLNELEHQLDCSLPQDVRESLQIHDGQEGGGRPTGIIFGSMLLDCEEIVQEWENWRKVNQQYLLDPAIANPAMPSKTLGGSSSGSAVASSSKAPASPMSPNNPAWRQDLLSRQACVPPGSVQLVYAHPLWIPLVRDWGGNCLAVDLAPGPTGRWGQVILFGRDYDTKYVVARSWSDFLALVASDLNSGKWFVDEETNELKLREFKTNRVEPGYLEILRWRMDQKYGGPRTAAKRRSIVPGASGSPNGSPYASPTEANGESRGRSLQRPNGKSPIASPIRLGHPKPSPLARVTEEAATPIQEILDPVPTLNEVKMPLKAKEKLVEVETPRPSNDFKAATQAPPTASGSAKAPDTVEPKSGALDDKTKSEVNVKPTGTNGKTKAEDEAETMKTVEI